MYIRAMRRLFLGCSIVLGCGAQPSQQAVSATTAAKPTTVAPLTPCDRASTGRARVTTLLAEGKLDRALRTLDAADRVCPAQASASTAPRAQILTELGVNAPSMGEKSAHDGAARALLADAERAEDAGDLARARALYMKSWDTWHPNGLALARAGLVAKRQGDAAGAQRLFDRAAVELAKETGQPLRPVPPPQPSSSYVQTAAVSSDGERTAWIEGNDVVVAWHGEPSLRLHRAYQASKLVFSADGNSLALFESSRVEVIDPRTGDVTRTFADEPGAATSMKDDLQPQSLVRWHVDDKTKKGHIEVVDAATKAVQRALDVPEPARVLALRRVGDDVVFVYTTHFAVARHDETRNVTIQHDPRCGGGTLGRQQADTRSMKVHVVDEQTKVFAQRVSIASGASTVRELASMKLRTVSDATPERMVGMHEMGLCNEPYPLFDDYAGEELGTAYLAADGTAVAIQIGTFARGARASAARAVVMDFAGQKLAEVRSDAGIQALALSPKGDMLLWSEQESKSLRAQPTTRGTGTGWSAATGYRPIGLAFSPNGARVTGVAEHAVFAIDMADGHMADHPAVAVSGHLGAYQVAASPDGAHVAVAATDHSVRLFHTDTSTMTVVPPAVAVVVNTFAFSSDSRVLAFAATARSHGYTNDPHVHLVAAATGAPIANLDVGKRYVWDLGFSSDGKTIAAATREPSIPTWDAVTGAARADIVVPDGKQVASVAYSPTRARIAAASESSVRLLDSGDGHVISATTLPNPIRTARFTPDGATLLVATAHEVQAFDAETLLPRWPAPLPARGGLLAVASDGSDGATAADDVNLFNIATGTLRAWSTSAKGVGAAIVGPSIISVDEHVVTVRDRASGDPRATMLLLERGAFATIATGELATFGSVSATSCASGAVRLPIDVCSERWIAKGALSRALGRGSDDELTP